MYLLMLGTNPPKAGLMADQLDAVQGFGEVLLGPHVALDEIDFGPDSVGLAVEVVGFLEIIQDVDLVASPKQQIDHVRSDQSGTSRNERFHKPRSPNFGCRAGTAKPGQESVSASEQRFGQLRFIAEA